jgi:hypothetical protein
MTIALMTAAAILTANRVTMTQIGYVVFKNGGAEVSSQNGNGIYYVRKNLDHNVLSCCCPAGNPPLLANGQLMYAPRPCWHKRAVLAKLQILAVEKREQAAAADLAIEEVFDYARRSR